MAFEILLASNSPRRRQLLGWTGISYAVSPADLDESLRIGENPVDYVRRLAQEKAHALTGSAPAGSLVLGSDTVVVDQGEILGKPADAADADRMLRQLRGHSHTVYTAIAVVEPLSGRTAVDLCSIQVPMREYSDAEIEAYIASGDPLDKAGAYAIQSAAFHPVEQFSGCYAGVMGMPLCHLLRTVRAEYGLDFPADVPSACQAGLRYSCPVTKTILEEQKSTRVEE